MKDQTEVSSLSRGMMLPGMAQPLSSPLQTGLGFFRHPLPALLSAPLTSCFPMWEQYGLTKFR